MKYLIICCCLFTFFCSAQTTWYVSTSGDNTNLGTSIDQAFADINFAIGSANCGDSIYLLAGNYIEKIIAYPICPESNRIVLQGDIANRPSVTGDPNQSGGKYAVSALGSGFRFRHIAFTSPNPTICNQENQVIVGNGDHFDFIDIIVRNSGYDGIKTYSECATNDFAQNWKIIDSEIYDNGLGCPASILNGDGIDMTGCRDCLIENTIIRNNMGHQVQIKLESKNVTVKNCHIEGKYLFQIGLPGNTPQCNPNSLNADSVYIRNNTILAKGDTSEFTLKLSDVSNFYFENNTVVKDGVDLDVGFFCFGGCTSTSTHYPTAPVVIKNNIFYSRANMPFYAGPDTSFFDPYNIIGTEVTANYNLFYDLHGDYVNSPDGGNNSLIADPLLCDFPNSFALATNSPCINAGDPTSNNDPDGSVNDIGAVWYATNCTTYINKEVLPLLKIYPNPASNILIIELANTNEIIAYQIINTQGKQLIKGTFTAATLSLDISDLCNGVYWFKTNKGNTLPIIINK